MWVKETLFMLYMKYVAKSLALIQSMIDKSCKINDDSIDVQ